MASGYPSISQRIKILQTRLDWLLGKLNAYIKGGTPKEKLSYLYKEIDALYWAIPILQEHLKKLDDAN